MSISESSRSVIGIWISYFTFVLFIVYLRRHYMIARRKSSNYRGTHCRSKIRCGRMPIMYSLEDAEKRLADRGPLNEKDVRDLIPYLGAIGGGGVWRLFADLALQNIAAIQKFDKSSSKLSTRLLFLTWVISALTFVMTLATILTAIPVVRSWCK